MDLKRQRINRILELTQLLLSFQTGFNLVNAAVVCAILESISGLEPSFLVERTLNISILQSLFTGRAGCKENVCVLIYYRQTYNYLFHTFSFA